MAQIGRLWKGMVIDMDKTVTGVLAYLGPILWIIAFVAGDKEGAKMHMNQGLVLIICEVITGVVSSFSGFIPLIGWAFGVLGGLLGIAVLVFIIMGIISVFNNDNKELPIIGQIKLLK